ncbi:hypothetical protein AEB_P2067 [Altererythrobacter sp. B11]|uniref:hypothetical protein n=1 Tax=Altererythrobacter sp. B11 TaxID=2060312 RepID=UPI000DC73AB1|nr:hypothetical protein [Altererythrobacter sp. B11]BBC72935.1 hypothetical protein AEB_P2067 [Altererythrobacter sp. B11]
MLGLNTGLIGGGKPAEGALVAAVAGVTALEDRFALIDSLAEVARPPIRGLDTVQASKGIAPNDGLNSIYNAPWGADEVPLTGGVDYNVRTRYKAAALDGGAIIDWWERGAVGPVGAPIGYYYVGRWNYRALPLSVERRFFRLRHITQWEESWSFDYTGSAEFSVLSECFMTAEPALAHNSFPTITAEPGFFYHLGERARTWHDGGNGQAAANYLRLDDWIDPQGRRWSVSWHRYNNYTNFVMGDGEDIRSGQVDKLAAMEWLMSLGDNPKTGAPFLDGDWFVNGHGLGIEPLFKAEAHAGSIAIKRFDVTFEGKVRIQAVNANLAYVLAPHHELGAIALKFQRNIGGSDAADSGAPWEPWRLTAIYAVGDIDDDPTSGVTLGSDIGAWDYAFQSGAVRPYGGSYHGGEVVLEYAGPDLLQSGYVPSFSFRQRSRITFANAVQIEMTHDFALDGMGTVRESVTATSAGSVNTRTLGMIILDSAFSAFSTDGGASYTELPADNSTVDLGDPTDLLLRNPITGHTVRQITDAPSRPQYTRISARRQARTKTYNEFDTAGALGTIAMERTLTFGATEPDPLPSWAPYTIDFTEATPGNAQLPLGVTREGGGTAPVTLDTSAGTMTIGGGSGTNRWVVTDPAKVLPPGDYVVTFTYTTSTANNTGRSQIAGVSTGSIVSDQISAAQSFNAPGGGTNIHTFTVPEGKTGYIAWESTTNTDGRTVTLQSISVTGAPA